MIMPQCGIFDRWTGMMDGVDKWWWIVFQIVPLMTYNMMDDTALRPDRVSRLQFVDKSDIDTGAKRRYLYKFSRIQAKQNIAILQMDLADGFSWMLISISMKYIAKGPISNKLALIHIMGWPQRGDKLLSTTMIVYFTNASTTGSHLLRKRKYVWITRRCFNVWWKLTSDCLTRSIKFVLVKT